MTPEFSVVIPVCNEAENVLPLAKEIAAALAGREFEVLFVDDGSTDQTAAAVHCRARGDSAGAPAPALVSQRAERGGEHGRALREGGVGRHARWRWPERSRGSAEAALPRTSMPANADVVLVQGHRTTRKDTAFRRFSPASRTACARACSAMARPTPAAASR